jgi:poly-gamma-glutamate synthesis protein (capsule biosynthesis protein)
MMRRLARGLGAVFVFLVMFVAWHWGLSYLAFRVSPVTLAPERIVREPLRKGRVTLLLAGDTGPGDAAEPTLRARGYDWAYRGTVDLLRGADISVVNLEMPITLRGEPPTLYKDYIYRARPDAAPALAWAGVDVVALSNNHVIDYGDVGLEDTIDAARAAGMVTIGAGRDEAEARRGLIAQVGDTRIGILDFCQRQPLWELWVDQFARGERPGAAALTERALADDIHRLRAQVDVLVVMLHIGYNYRPPSDAAVAWSRRAVELGADLVVDSHPHIAHPLMAYEGKPIALSVGNYAFGTQGHDELSDGLLVFAEIEDRRLDRIELVPIDVQNRRVDYQPHPLTGTALDESLRRLIAGSRERGATLTRVGDRAVYKLPRHAS